MPIVHVQYQTQPEQSDQNQQLIEAVFDELNEKAPKGVSYRAFRLEDGVTFVHLAEIADGFANPIPGLAAFKAFTAELKTRCDVPPKAQSAIPVGSYSEPTR